MEDIFIYVPSVNQIVMIAEGTGDNLLGEDIAQGYVDYINYEQYSVEQDFPQMDGGMILKYKYLSEIYSSLKDAIPDVLDMAYGNKGLGYIVLENHENHRS